MNMALPFDQVNCIKASYSWKFCWCLRASRGLTRSAASHAFHRSRVPKKRMS